MRQARVAIVVVVGLWTGLVFVPGSVAQYPGKNGMLSWLFRLPTGYKQGDNAIQGVGPVPAGQPSGAATLFPGFTRAVWSPDGNSALLEKRGFGTGEIYLWTASKGVSSRPIVTAPPNWGGVGNAAWSPGGKRFAFLAFDSGNIAYGQIWEADADGSNAHQLYPDSRVFFDLSWGRTPSGDRIAMVTGCGDVNAYNYPRICLFDPDAPEQPAVPVPGRAGNDPDFSMTITSVDWSPDGSGKLLVSAHPTVQGTSPTACNGNPCVGGNVCDRVTTACDTNGEIFVVDPQTGGEARELTQTPGLAGPYESSAVWSPDGSEIAYLAAGPREWASVWIANYTGGSNPQISSQRRVSQPAPKTDVKYFVSPSWQPCVAGVTQNCVTASSAAQAPASSKSSVPAARSASTCGGKCGITSAKMSCGQPSPADVTGKFTFKAPDSSSVSALWRFSFFKSDGTLLRRFPKSGWYGPHGVGAGALMTKTAIYATSAAKRMLATVQDDNDPTNTWSKYASC